MRVLTIIGTRPEAIKMAPVIARLNEADGIEHFCCVTGQHRQMLDQILGLFSIRPDDDLNLMVPNQTPSGFTAVALEAITNVIAKKQPDWVLVQGDTVTAFAGALAAFYARVKVGHVEAGLRTGNLASPWPEEGNRKLISAIASLHFAPTAVAEGNLLKENVAPRNIHITGNTVIDALQTIESQISGSADLQRELAAQFPFRDGRRLILVTGHRRENLQQGGLLGMCEALKQIAARGDIQIIYPVHMNPNVQRQVQSVLADVPDVHLIAPLDYRSFVYLLSKSHFVITDSGGIQEEAPALAKPVLVTRDTTERPEAISAGTAKLVGTNSAELLHWATELLDHEDVYRSMAQVQNPFGDGKASARIVRILQARDRS